MILAKAWPGIRFNEHMEGDGETVFRHACKLGLEGFVSPAVKREEEEEWGKRNRDERQEQDHTCPRQFSAVEISLDGGLSYKRRF
jgi:hypothetical protein